MTDKQKRASNRTWLEFQILKSFKAQVKSILRKHDKTPSFSDGELIALDSIMVEVQALCEHLELERKGPFSIVYNLWRQASNDSLHSTRLDESKRNKSRSQGGHDI